MIRKIRGGNMKQTYIKSALIIALITAALPASGVIAQEKSTDLSVPSESVKIYDKEIDGDLFCYGSKIEINAPVNGDVLCVASESLTINAKVNGDLRVVSPSVILGASSEIGLNASILAQNLESKSGSKIGRDLMAYASDVSLISQIGRDSSLAGVNVYLGGSYGRNVKVRAENFTIPIDGKILGDLDYSAKTSDMNSGSIEGKMTSVPFTTDGSMSMGGKTGFDIFGFIYSLGLLALGLVFIALRKKYLLEATDKINPLYVFSTIGLGFLVAFTIPIIAIILLVSGLATTIGIAVLLVWALMLVLAMPAFAFYLARHSIRMINKAEAKPAVTMIVGTIFVIFAGFVPGLSIITKGFGYFMGLGLLFRQFFRKETQVSLPNEIEHERTIASGKNIAQKLEQAEVENDEGGK